VALFQPNAEPASLLELFLQRHSSLLRSAESLTHDRREAEDLLQDAFVRLLLAQPDVTQIENVDAYLRTTVRNLQMTRVRRRHLLPETTLSIVDYDSAGFALTALSHALPLQARDALRAVCRFACARRHTSKTGSIFLLHFFHEYVPAEIASIARLRRQSVDTGLTRGRAEVRAYLDDPAAAAAAVGLSDVPELRIEPSDAAGVDYIARLRSAIFELRHRQCYEPQFLARLYADDGEQIPTEVLGQLVTCPVCLDAVNRLTSLPVSIDRHPFDPPRATSARRFLSGKGSERRICERAAQHQVRVVRAHRPRLLRVLVNGFQVGSHDVTGELTRSTHVLSSTDAPHIVEVCSEQGVYLATLQLNQVPDAAVLQQCVTVLDEGRRLEIGVTFDAPRPTLRLTYSQPVEACAPEEEEAGELPRVVQSASARRLFMWPLLVGRYAGWALALTVGAWLFFFTPGVTVSAAERVRQAIVDVWQRWFDDSRALSPTQRLLRVRTDIVLPATDTIAKPPAIRTRAPGLSDAALARLEVDSLIALQRLDALAGQRIQVARTNSDVTVSGIVEDVSEADLVAALRAVTNGRALAITLQTPAAVAAVPPSRATARAVVQAMPADTNAIPAAADIYGYLIASSFAGDPGAETRRLANQGLRLSRAALLEGLALERLAERYDEVTGAVAGVDMTMKWRELLSTQAAKVRGAVAQLRAQLAPVFAPSARSSSDHSPSSNVSDADTRVLRDARQIGGALVNTDRDIRAALAVAAVPATTTDVKSDAFWERLVSLERSLTRLITQLATP
jgi:DNA-directed RNA polymerase specialized sigma24 family protein